MLDEREVSASEDGAVWRLSAGLGKSTRNPLAHEFFEALLTGLVLDGTC
jgi:hypothetical protein